jgi:hypothetical protein
MNPSLPAIAPLPAPDGPSGTTGEDAADKKPDQPPAVPGNEILPVVPNGKDPYSSESDGNRPHHHQAAAHDSVAPTGLLAESLDVPFKLLLPMLCGKLLPVIGGRGGGWRLGHKPAPTTSQDF